MFRCFNFQELKLHSIFCQFPFEKCTFSYQIHIFCTLWSNKKLAWMMFLYVFSNYVDRDFQLWIFFIAILMLNGADTQMIWCWFDNTLNFTWTKYMLIGFIFEVMIFASNSKLRSISDTSVTKFSWVQNAMSCNQVKQDESLLAKNTDIKIFRLPVSRSQLLSKNLFLDLLLLFACR